MAFTSKKKIIHIVLFLIVIILVILAVIIFLNKPSRALISAVDSSWSTTKLESQPEYIVKLDQLSSYKLNSVKHQDGKDIIKVTITAPDLCSQLLSLDPSELPQAKDDVEINAFLCEQVEKAELKQTTTFIYAYKDNGEYHITFSADFVDAMSGNLYTYSQTALIEILQKYKGELK